ncbi:MAG: HAD family phosphatase [Proteobacteria bacterium]|nr:HAD family phosphatase [Pseudomonadota bacterium]
MNTSKYRLLALDLDGTLTNSQKKVSEKNRKYIRLAQEKGVDIILASGRPVIGIESVAKALNLYETGGYILAYNGGQIIDCKTQKPLIEHFVPSQYYHEICDIIHRFHVFPLTYNRTGVICENDEDRYVHQECYNNSVPLHKVECLEAELNGPIVKFMVVGEPEELNKAAVYFRECFKGALNVFFSEPYFMEITPPGIEKSSALAALLKLLNIPREELMACGDGLNDIPMLEYAGFSVAMANAYEETKKYADFISASNEDDGVALAIERFILQGTEC